MLLISVDTVLMVVQFGKHQLSPPLLSGHKRYGSRPADVFCGVTIERVESDESMDRILAGFGRMILDSSR